MYSIYPVCTAFILYVLHSPRAHPLKHINTPATNAMYWCNRATTITCTHTTSVMLTRSAISKLSTHHFCLNVVPPFLTHSAICSTDTELHTSGEILGQSQITVGTLSPRRGCNENGLQLSSYMNNKQKIEQQKWIEIRTTKIYYKDDAQPIRLATATCSYCNSSYSHTYMYTYVHVQTSNTAQNTKSRYLTCALKSTHTSTKHVCHCTARVLPHYWAHDHEFMTTLNQPLHSLLIVLTWHGYIKWPYAVSNQTDSATASLKAGSQYDACTSIASLVSGRWTQFLFQHCVASAIRNTIWVVKKSFSCDAHDACGASITAVIVHAA